MTLNFIVTDLGHAEVFDAAGAARHEGGEDRRVLRRAIQSRFEVCPSRSRHLASDGVYSDTS